MPKDFWMGFIFAGTPHKQKKNLLSPVKCFLVMLTVIFVVELIVMQFLDVIAPQGSVLAASFLDSLLLTVISSPFLWFVIIRPLRASTASEQEWISSLLGKINDGVVTFDRQGKILTFNRVSEEMFQCTSADMVGQPFGRLVSHAGLPQEPSSFTPAVDNDDLLMTCQEVVGWRNAQTAFPLELSISQSESVLNHFFVAILRDISERREMESEIAHARDEWEEVFSTIKDAIVIVDDDHNVVRSNAAAAEMLQLSAEVLHGQKCFQSVHGTTHPPRICASCEVMKTLSATTLELYEPHLKRHLEVKVLPRLDKDGKLKGLIHVMSDISERKLADEERQDLIKQLEKRNEELEAFTYTVSHDLKTPLVTIGGFVGQLRNDLEKGNHDCLAVDLDFIESSATQMGDLLNNLLLLARSGRVISAPQPVMLVNIINEALQFSRGVLDKCTTRVYIADELPSAYGDPDRLREVIQNLLENAAKFTTGMSAPLIELGCTAVENELLVYVRDNGIGIPVEYQMQVFKLFEKLDPLAKGTGIGLAIVKRIVEEHGGRIWIESAGEGLGTTFWFTLPLENYSTKAKPDNVQRGA